MNRLQNHWYFSSLFLIQFLAFGAIFAQIHNPAPYCAPLYIHNCGADSARYIQRVVISNVDNRSTCIPSSPINYIYYNNALIHQIELALQATYVLKLEIGPQPVAVAAWIDWNKNNLFDSSERVLATPTGRTNAGNIQQIITVPAGAVPGLTRLRIRAVGCDSSENNPLLTAIDPACQLIAATASAGQGTGETEDYPVNVAPPQIACEIPVAAINSGICRGTTLPVYYYAAGGYNPGNQFRVELSNGKGVFSSSSLILADTVMHTPTPPDTFSITIPLAIPPDSGYRVRVTSTDPYRAGSDNGQNIVVLNLASPQIFGDEISCQNKITRYYTTTQASFYNWNVLPGTLLSGANNDTITVQWPSTGVWQVRLLVQGGGCLDSAVFFTVIVPQPVAPAILGPQELCYGAPPVQYYLSTNTTDTIEWIPVGGKIVSGQGTRFVQVAWTDSGALALKLIVRNSYGCVDTGIYAVNVTPPRAPEIRGPQLLCDSVGVFIYDTEFGRVSYNWSVDGGVVVSGQNTPIAGIRWTRLGKARIRVVSLAGAAAGCPDTSYLEVEIGERLNLPPIISGDTAVCERAEITYSCPNPLTNLRWTVQGGELTGLGGTSLTVIRWTTPGIGKVILTGTNICGVTDSSELIVRVVPLPVRPSLRGDSLPCPEGPIFEYIADGLSDSVYFQVEGGTIVSQESNKLRIAWFRSGAGKIVITTINTQGCKDSVVFPVRVLAFDAGNLPSQALAICPEGTSISVSGPAGFPYYSWSTGAVGPQATFTQPGRYQLIVGNTAGCFDTINFIITNCKQFSDSEFDSTLTDFPLTGLRILLALDYNNDNYEDIFALNTQGYLRLYENTTALSGGQKAGYLDVTAGAGLPENLAVYQIIPADYDHDGNPDLFCFRSGDLRIFRYSGAGKTAGGKYTEVTADLCLRNPFLGDTAYSSTVLDIEPDGDPDIIAMRKRATDNSRILALNRADAIACNPVTSYCAESLVVDLGINVDPLVRYFDFDLDNDLDLLILAYNQALPNIEHPVKLYRNDNGSFEDATVRSRLDDYQMSFPGFATIADFNEDGRPDILGGSMNSGTARNRVLQGTDIGTFVDASGLFLLKTQNYLYHQANCVDIDNDGDLDVSWATQGINEPFLLFRNQGVPNFVESSDSLGLGKRNVPNAVWTDADNDGDLDLFLSNPAGQTWYLRNNTDTAKNRFLRIRLAGCRALKDGRGATVTVVTKNKRITQYYLHGIGSNAATGNILHFGLGGADKADTIIVKWIGGNQSKLVNIAANQLITIQENTPCLDTVPEAKFSVTPIDNDSLKLQFINQSIGADRYFWIFGDGQTSFETNPTKIYQQRGNYTIQLVAFNRCGSDTANYVWRLLSRPLTNESLSFSVYPNPAHEKVIIRLEKTQPAGTPIEITLVDIHGKAVRHWQNEPNDLIALDLADVTAGYYTLMLKSETASGFQKLAILPKSK